MEADQNSERRHYSEINDVGVFFVNCERISHFLLIVDFEQKNVSWIHTEKTNTFEDKIGHVVLF